MAEGKTIVIQTDQVHIRPNPDIPGFKLNKDITSEVIDAFIALSTQLKDIKCKLWKANL